MKTTYLTLIAAMMLANTAQAANWQTAAADVVSPAATGSISTKSSYFQITSDDVTREVARQIAGQGVRQEVQATMSPATTTIIHAADHPLTLAVHGLQVDPDAQLWQAQAYILANGRTESVKPIAGRYEGTMRVPVLTRQFKRGDVITVSDIELRSVAERQLRKDTIDNTAALVGQSPVRMISAGRPIRAAEISRPAVVKKGQLVQMHYTTPYMTIRTTGEALEDGSTGSLIRVKNTKSEKAVSARVTSEGNVEVNSES